MSVVLMLVGIVELLSGIAILFNAKSAIHEILGTLMVGFCFLTVGLAAILDELRRARISGGDIHITK